MFSKKSKQEESHFFQWCFHARGGVCVCLCVLFACVHWQHEGVHPHLSHIQLTKVPGSKYWNCRDVPIPISLAVKDSQALRISICHIIWFLGRFVFPSDNVLGSQYVRKWLLVIWRLGYKYESAVLSFSAMILSLGYLTHSCTVSQYSKIHFFLLNRLIFLNFTTENVAKWCICIFSKLWASAYFINEHT